MFNLKTLLVLVCFSMALCALGGERLVGGFAVQNSIPKDD